MLPGCELLPHCGLYFANAATALQRGYHVLAFDGPGRGSVILEQEIGFRPDWESVVTPVVDFALTLPGVDSTKLVLVCPREYVMFAAEDDVSWHCEMTARRLFHQRVYDWLDGVLALTPTAQERDGG